MRELFLFDMPQQPSVTMGDNTIHAIVTLDESGCVIGDIVAHKGKMITPTMHNRGPQVIAIAGSDTLQYFNPEHGRHYQSTIALYEDALEKTNSPEVKAILAFAKDELATSLDFSGVKAPQDPKTKTSDINKAKLAFVYAPTGEYLHDCESIVGYWRDLREPKTIDAHQIQCSITHRIGTRLTDAPADVKFGAIKGKLFSCNTDDAVSFGSPKYGSTGVTIETYTELVQRLNYLGNSDEHRLSIGQQTLLIWTDGASVKPLWDGLQGFSRKLDAAPREKKTRKKGSTEPIEIVDTSLEGIRKRLLSLWKGAHSIARLDASHFYVTTVTAQKGRIELSPICRAKLVEVVENIAIYHARQLRFSPYSRPHWAFLDGIYPKVSKAANKPYADGDRRAVFDHAIYGKRLPRALISKALGRLRVEGVPIGCLKHQLKISDRAYTQLSFLSLEIPMAEITELPPLQQQAYALGRLYSYACRQADQVSSTQNHGVRKLWGQINRNPKRALYQLAKRFPVYTKAVKEQLIFNSLYRSVMEACPDVPEKVDLDYGVAFMWGISAKGKQADEPTEVLAIDEPIDNQAIGALANEFAATQTKSAVAD